MVEIKKYFVCAQLAQASYGKFLDVSSGDNNALIEKLRRAGEGDFAEKQVEAFMGLKGSE